MPPIADPTLLSALTLATSLGAGFLALTARGDRHRAREIELQEAIDLLKVHCDKLELLDDDDMPADLLDLAVGLSEVLHHPEFSRWARVSIRAGLPRGTDEKSDTEAVDDVEGDQFFDLLKRRSDLAIAFIQCLVAGLMAFEKRWPECAGVIAPSLPRVLISPVEEAHRVVHAAESFRTWSAPVRAAAA